MTTVIPPDSAPVAPKPVDATVAWAIALAPAVGIVLALVVPTDLTLVITAANITLCLIDSMRLKQAGYGPIGAWVVLVPLYLWKRARLTASAMATVWVWLALFAAWLVVPGLVATTDHREVACELVTEILAREDSTAPTCKGVVVTQDPGTGFVKGTALLSDGSERVITIEARGDSVEVQVLPQQ